MEKNDKIYVAGHLGLVGSSLIRNLIQMGYNNLITKEQSELDLTNQQAVNNFFAKEKPDYIFLAAAKVGGIAANQALPAEFIYQNLIIEANVIHAAHLYNVKKIIFLGSSCIYPRLAPQPIKESYLLTSPLEKTNEAYAIAKIAGIKLCEYYYKQYGFKYIAAMPTNLYGPNDNFDLESSHVLPAMIRKFDDAKITNSPDITLWGSGSVYREFLHVDDLAMALIFLINSNQDNGLINIGTGEDLTIKELAEKIKKIVDFNGEIIWDQTKPDGTPRKLLDIGLITSLGWKPQIQLEDGLQKTYDWYLRAKQENNTRQ
jgi:GDP-L-fucose synthase